MAAAAAVPQRNPRRPIWLLDTIHYKLPISVSKTTLQFSCQPGCTRCCDQEGYVYLTERDLQQAAKHLGMTAAAFEKQYVYRTKHLLRLRKPKDSQCHFLGAAGCDIHSAKPTQCRLFPFWPHLVESRREWNSVGKWCPGIGQGELIQIGTAHEMAAEMNAAYPAICGGLRPGG